MASARLTAEMHDRLMAAATFWTPGSFRRNASKAEASSTASVTAFPFGFFTTTPDQFFRQLDIRRSGVGKERLHLADDRLQGTHDDAGLRGLQDDGIARFDPVALAQ